MTRYALLLVIAACSHTPSETEVIDYLHAQPATARSALEGKAEGRIERTDLIHRSGKSLTLVGPTLDLGDPLPVVTLTDGKLAPIDLAALRGKIIVLSVVPSIDTHVCETQTHKVNAAIDQMPPGVEVFTVSRDLPFAQTRFSEEAQTKIKMASDYRGGAFGRAFGVEVKETGLLARSMWVIGADGKVAYRELVDDQGTEPDYDAMIAAVKRVAGT